MALFLLVPRFTRLLSANIRPSLPSILTIFSLEWGHSSPRGGLTFFHAQRWGRVHPKGPRDTSAGDLLYCVLQKLGLVFRPKI
jgi:hypothetical protein